MTTVGRSALTAAMICAGRVLSQPPITITASIGWARIISSVSIAIRLRRYIEVGYAKLSAIEMVGNTHRLDEGLAQEQRKPGVAIARQTLAQPVRHLSSF